MCDERRDARRAAKCGELTLRGGTRRTSRRPDERLADVEPRERGVAATRARGGRQHDGPDGTDQQGGRGDTWRETAPDVNPCQHPTALKSLEPSRAATGPVDDKRPPSARETVSPSGGVLAPITTTRVGHPIAIRSVSSVFCSSKFEREPSVVIGRVQVAEGVEQLGRPVPDHRRRAAAPPSPRTGKLSRRLLSRLRLRRPGHPRGLVCRRKCCARCVTPRISLITLVDCFAPAATRGPIAVRSSLAALVALEDLP